VGTIVVGEAGRGLTGLGLEGKNGGADVTMGPMGWQVTTHTSLLARLVEGTDPTAWREFSERYGELICNFGRRRGLQPVDCEDLVQEVLLVLSKAMPKFEYDPQKGKFRAYLKTVTLHAISKILGQKRGMTPLETIEQTTDAASNEAAEEIWNEEWHANHVRRALRVIEPESSGAQLRAFQRYAIEGREARAVTEDLRLTVNQVYQTKSRVLKRLAELVQEQVQEEG
jgi:RNA polymerase sigma-70 factor (ECF subfamily)